MTKLEQLKQFVKEQFDKAENKDSIDMLSHIQNSISDVEKDTADLENKVVELTKDYKDLVKHTSFKDDNKVVREDPITAKQEAPSLTDILSQFANKDK
jgi:hypothetical protein